MLIKISTEIVLGAPSIYHYDKMTNVSNHLTNTISGADSNVSKSVVK